MRIVVTGGSGLVGRAIVRRLAKRHDVVNVDIVAPAPAASGHPLVEHLRTDILDLAGLGRALSGAHAVVHAAAIPGPSFGSEDEIQEVNIEGTRNVALAAGAAGTRRVVLISSESVLGFAFSDGAVVPRYLPVDEAHPLAPRDPYGRSKLAAETLLAQHAQNDTTVVSIRPPWVWVPEEYEKYRLLTTSPEKWVNGLWAYVHGDDLARAVERAATLDIDPGFHAVYISAPDNGTDVPTTRLVENYLSGVPVHGKFEEYGSLVSCARLESLLGFRPAMSWREFLR